MNGAIAILSVCVLSLGQVRHPDPPDPRSDFPVRQIVLSKGVLYAVDSEPSPGHCATGLVQPLDGTATIERLPLVGMCALEIGRGPYPWSIQRGTFTYLTVDKPPGDPQVICLVAQPSIAQLREYRAMRPHRLQRLAGGPGHEPRGLGALSIERVDAAIRAAEMDFHASMHNYDDVLLYALRRGELRVWRSIADESNPREVKEQTKILTIDTPMQGPFRVVRFGKRDYLIDVTGIVYRVTREGVRNVGRIPHWPEGEKLSTQRQYIVFYDVERDSSRLYLLTPEGLEPLQVIPEDPQQKIEWLYAEFPEDARELALELARLTWGDVLREHPKSFSRE